MMFAKRNMRWKAVGRVQKFCGFMWLVDGVPTQTLPADKMGEGRGRGKTRGRVMLSQKTFGLNRFVCRGKVFASLYSLS